MAFSPEEDQIIEWARQNGKTGEETRDAIFRFRQTGSPRVAGAPEPEPTTPVRDVGVGFAKGVGETIFETGRLAQGLGQRTLAAVSPTRTLEDVRAETGFGVFEGERAEQISERLEADTTAERAGKVLAFGAEILLPLPKKGALDRVTSFLRGGRERVGTQAESAFDAVESTAQRLGIRVEDALNPIDEGVQTVLRRTDKATFEDYVETARKAAVEPKAATGLEVAGKKAEDALDIIQRKLGEFGSQKSTILNRAAVGNKPVGNIVVKFRQNLDNIASGRTLDSGDQKLIKDISAEAKKLGDNPTAKQVDGFIDFVQDKVFTSQRSLSIDVTDSTTSAVRRFSGELNDALKDQLPDAYRQANKNFSDLVGLRNELNQKLGKDGERAASLMKRVFSPSDARTKKMFQEVLDVTNIDLIDEAVLARYTMRVFGDNRQRSLLDTVLEAKGTTPTSRAVNLIVDKILGRFKGTEAELRKALRIIEE